MSESTAVQPGHLYVVATPIGHLGDLSPRAAAVLGAVDAILAEDTRTSAILLQHLGLQRPLIALHEHNERERAEGLLQGLREGRSLALISDAGTPLISDPGFVLVRAVRDAGLPVITVPGPCALIAAVSCRRGRPLGDPHSKPCAAFPKPGSATNPAIASPTASTIWSRSSAASARLRWHAS
jgi:precorrin-3B methylase